MRNAAFCYAGCAMSGCNKKKPQDLVPRFYSLLIAVANYSATVELTAAESATTLSAANVSTTAVSVAVESAPSALAVLLPQDAKEIAAIATNIKTNFFIFFAF